jgi:hypothetical protein
MATDRENRRSALRASLDELERNAPVIPATARFVRDGLDQIGDVPIEAVKGLAYGGRAIVNRLQRNPQLFSTPGLDASRREYERTTGSFATLGPASPDQRNPTPASIRAPSYREARGTDFSPMAQAQPTARSTPAADDTTTPSRGIDYSPQAADNRRFIARRSAGGFTEIVDNDNPSGPRLFTNLAGLDASQGDLQRVATAPASNQFVRNEDTGAEAFIGGGLDNFATSRQALSQSTQPQIPWYMREGAEESGRRRVSGLRRAYQAGIASGLDPVVADEQARLEDEAASSQGGRVMARERMRIRREPSLLDQAEASTRSDLAQANYRQTLAKIIAQYPELGLNRAGIATAQGSGGRDPLKLLGSPEPIEDAMGNPTGRYTFGNLRQADMSPEEADAFYAFVASLPDTAGYTPVELYEIFRAENGL